ncbi:unnamed protein product, partial [Anisakis simplex]|uniref:ALA-interacting subunit n=1 Tax=Anisakis simplex TaxID=6269 RepID=A0A0M3KBI5_ANISI
MPDLVANIPRRRGNRNKPNVHFIRISHIRTNCACVWRINEPRTLSSCVFFVISEAKWRQQALPAYRPLLTARCAIPITFVVGAVFICIGVILYLAATASKEVVIDYTNCTTVSESLNASSSFKSKQCLYNITLEEYFAGSVMFQYGLDRFYQNSRMYIKSRNDVQLFGDVNATSDCEPFAVQNVNGHLLAIVPCGTIANSMFNDTFALYYLPPNGEQRVLVPFSSENVIWAGERQRKFRNPPFDPAKNQTLCDAFVGTVKPPNWAHPICELGKNDPFADQDPGIGVGLENIDFIVWMKPAALPKFRKNYRT